MCSIFLDNQGCRNYLSAGVTPFYPNAHTFATGTENNHSHHTFATYLVTCSRNIRNKTQLATASSPIYKTVSITFQNVFFPYLQQHWETQTVAFSSKITVCRALTNSGFSVWPPQHCRRNYFITTYLHIIYNSYKNYSRTRSMTQRC